MDERKCRRCGESPTGYYYDEGDGTETCADCVVAERDELEAEVERLKKERVIHREPVVGDRVIVAHWSDFDPLDAFRLGTLSSIEDGYFYIFGSSRAWRHCKFIATIDGEEG